MKEQIRQKHSIAKRTASILTCCGLAMSSMMLTGCFGGGEEEDPNAVKVSQTTFQINEDAINDMCNSALKLTVTGMQRRPTSTFAGSSIAGSDLSGANASSVSATNSNDIAIQVDVSYTWNINTYMTALENAGQSTSGSNNFRSLSELLKPGTLMYVEGVDGDGNPYFSADIITPDAQDDVNALAINAQWDYDVMHSALPETSVTKTGSFLLRVPSTAQDLKLVINTPMAGQPIDDDVSYATYYTYELPLT